MTKTFQASFFPETPLIAPAMLRQLRYAYNRAERRARENGLPFELHKDYVIEPYRRQDGHCAATGLKINCQHAYHASSNTPLAPASISASPGAATLSTTPIWSAPPTISVKVNGLISSWRQSGVPDLHGAIT
jgi:hypothetical protein